jgi:hypothetical protein
MNLTNLREDFFNHGPGLKGTGANVNPSYVINITQTSINSNDDRVF